MTKKQKCCMDCDDCIYIGEGDYICDNAKFDEEAIVLTEYETPTDNYMRCEKIKQF